jgi:hypothetical protein
MRPIDVDEIDLEVLASALERRFGTRFSASYLEGKSMLRDAVEAELRCSDTEAEQLVETLESQGLLRFPHLPDDTHPANLEEWEIAPSELRLRS